MFEGAPGWGPFVVYGLSEMDVQEIVPHLWHWSAPHQEWKP